MAVAVYFHPTAMTLAQFEEVGRLLMESGQPEPPGRLHHSLFGEDGSLMVYDIWESEEAYAKFAATLLPLCAQAGIEVGQPVVMPVLRMAQVAVE